MAVSVLGISILINWILYVGFAVAIDTVFGFMRAVKERKWNSSVGIDGAIRKISMLACMTFMVVLDRVCGFNLIQIFTNLQRYKIHICTLGKFQNDHGIVFR